MAESDQQAKEFLRLKDGRLYHREGQELEFKEQFNLAGLAEYLRDFAAFGNNRGGFLIFGVADSPRTLAGLSNASIDRWDKVDPEKITGHILEYFSCDIPWSWGTFKAYGKTFGYFRVHSCPTKPVIAKKDGGRDQEIRNGDIYYRYGGRTQRIQSAELENIINARVNQTNQAWLDLMSKIGRVGAQNAAILDTESGLIEKGQNQVLVIDDELAGKLSFIKEGAFSEKHGATTLKLVGNVTPVDRVEVTRKVKENLTKSYPLSASELAEEVKRKIPESKQHEVWNVIKDNDMKRTPDYSAYNFRNKKQEDHFHTTGSLPSVTPSIYNFKAVDFIVKVLQSKKEA